MPRYQLRDVPNDIWEPFIAQCALDQQSPKKVLLRLMSEYADKAADNARSEKLQTAPGDHT